MLLTGNEVRRTGSPNLSREPPPILAQRLSITDTTMHRQLCMCTYNPYTIFVIVGTAGYLRTAGNWVPNGNLNNNSTTFWSCARLACPCRQHRYYSLFCYALLNCSRFFAIWNPYRFINSTWVSYNFNATGSQWQFRTASLWRPRQMYRLVRWSKAIIALQQASYHSDPPESLTASILEFLKVCPTISASWLYILAISPLQSALSVEQPSWIRKAPIGKSHIRQIATARIPLIK